MKLLLDENIPRKLKNDLWEFDVHTVREMNWDGKKNGELLELMLKEGFEVLITADKNLKNQQNFDKYPIPVLTLDVRLLTYPFIVELLPELKEYLNSKLNNGATLVTKDRQAL